MTLRDELREAVVRVEHARDAEAEARAEIQDLETRHRALYDARHQAIENRSRAEADAKAKRLILYHLALKDGEWRPGENLFGLTVERRLRLEYEDDVAIQWLVRRLQAGDDEAWHWMRLALDKNRPAFETLVRGKPQADRWIGLHEKQEPQVKIAQGPRLAPLVAATTEAEAQAPGDAEDALADLAIKMQQKETE